MQQFTYFSRHAFDRIAQRTRLSYEEIARILDRKLAVNTGRKPGFNRNHLVFYSIPDDDFFVAIQDGLTGTVITILPLEYQANLAWKISDEDCIEARRIIMSAPEEEIPTQIKLTAVSSIGHRNIICSNLDLGGGVYGTNGTTWIICCAESRVVA